MPGTVKTKEEERLWNKAKGLAKDQGHTEDWAYIMGIFQKMKGKKASTLRETLIRIAYDNPGGTRKVLLNLLGVNDKRATKSSEKTYWEGVLRDLGEMQREIKDRDVEVEREHWNEVLHALDGVKREVRKKKATETQGEIE